MDAIRILQAVPDKDLPEEIGSRALCCKARIQRECASKGTLTDMEIAYILKKYGFHFELFEMNFDLFRMCWDVRQLTDTERRIYGRDNV